MFSPMKRNSASLALLVALVSLAGLRLTGAEEPAGNDGKAQPYESIVERNPFGLRPPPPPAPPDAGPVAPPPPLATVELTGVTSIFSKKKALVEIVPGPGKQPLKLTLDEGERVDAIEIVSIDVDKAEVVIKNAGAVTNLSLKVAKATAGAPAAAVPNIPGLPGLPGVPSIAPPIVPTMPTTTANNAFGSSSRSAPIVAGGNAPVGGFTPQPINTFGQPGTVGQPGGIYTSPGAGAGAISTAPGLINRPIRTQTPGPAEPHHPAVDPAVQYINMAVQKQTMESKGVSMPPLPPVPGLD